MLKRKYLISFIFLFHLCSLSAQWNTERILTIGRNALYFEDYVLSIQYFNQVIKIKPYLAEPYMYRSIAKIQLGDFEGAELDGNEAIKRNPFLPQAFYARGFTKMKLEKFEEAVADFTKAMEFSPNNQHLLISRMYAYERMEDYDAAIDDIDEFLKRNPRHSILLYDKGRLYMAKNDTIAAEKAFNQLIEADSTSFIGWSARGLLKLQAKDYDGAYRDYSTAIQHKSDFYGDYINRGIINVEQNRYMEALADYDRAIQLAPKSLMAYLNRAVLRANLGDNNNALADFETVLSMDSTISEARYSKALLEMKLRNFENAIADYQIIIEKHPYFLPAYWGIAEAYTELNNMREAYKYRKKAHDLEENKENIREQIQQDLEAKKQIAAETPESTTGHKAEVFNRYAAHNITDSSTESQYDDERRGAVQNRFVDVVNEKNFVLTYYSKPDNLRQTNLYYEAVEFYNRKKVLAADLKITCQEIALTNELINKHFETINIINATIEHNSNDADIYFYRAMEFALVQDFESAIEDLNKAILLRSDFALAYFTRANIRYKFIDYMRNSFLESGASTLDIKEKQANFEKEKKYDVEMVMRDLDKVNELMPDFAFAYYNKANIIASQQDFKTAIYHYSKAIEHDPDFAEAYFNRGLTHLFTGENTKGLSDLSKAGELGIYQAYNLIQRFKE